MLVDFQGLYIFIRKKIFYICTAVRTSNAVFINIVCSLTDIPTLFMTTTDIITRLWFCFPSHILEFVNDLKFSYLRLPFLEYNITTKNVFNGRKTRLNSIVHFCLD
jgi:hypothetical protein